MPAACHIVEQYANNPIEADHSRLKARLRPMRGLKRLHPTGNQRWTRLRAELRRGHYELGVNVGPRHRLPAVFTELARAHLRALLTRRETRRRLAA
jgi:hypothetical protein